MVMCSRSFAYENFGTTTSFIRSSGIRGSRPGIPMPGILATIKEFNNAPTGLSELVTERGSGGSFLIIQLLQDTQFIADDSRASVGRRVQRVDGCGTH